MNDAIFTPRNFELERLLEELTAKVDRIDRAMNVGRDLHESRSWLHRRFRSDDYCSACVSAAFRVAGEVQLSDRFRRRAAELVAGIKANHKASGNREPGALMGHCVTCMTAWPCPTARLVEPHDELVLAERKHDEIPDTESSEDDR